MYLSDPENVTADADRDGPADGDGPADRSRAVTDSSWVDADDGGSFADDDGADGYAALETLDVREFFEALGLPPGEVGGEPTRVVVSHNGAKVAVLEAPISRRFLVNGLLANSGVGAGAGGCSRWYFSTPAANDFPTA